MGGQSATIRVWGSPEMAGVLRRWQEGFREQQKQVQFENHLYGTASSIAGIYTGVADLSLLGRDIWPIESMAFESVLSYRPLGVQVATGSYDIPKATFALVVYVNRANPLGRLTTEQLAGVFGIPEREDAKAVRTWGDLGLTGEWSNAPIHTYQFAYDNDKAIFFRRKIFGERYRWKDTNKEFSNRVNPDGTSTDSGRLILEALARDPWGIAVSNPHYASEQVKSVALSQVPGVYAGASRRTVADRTYPLTRAVWIYVNRAPAKPLDPSVCEFLRYVVSRRGQQDVIADGTYLPLTQEIATGELRKLDPN